MPSKAIALPPLLVIPDDFWRIFSLKSLSIAPHRQRNRQPIVPKYASNSVKKHPI
ncbi:MAG TPA: hypothetical protein IGS31_03765 [Oscillatoriales cyanobacterium M4454_W2019_049]|nr:hypothetical protein [Oscillatoriales cyanobacterium M4454_W2019_049]